MPQQITNEEERDYFVKHVLIYVDNATAIEEETQLQSLSNCWFVHRSKRITSSNFGRVIKRRETTDPDKLIKELTVEKIAIATPNQPAALQWGKEKERSPIDEYCLLMEEDERIIDSGLIINPKYPWLGCSPDGIAVSKEGTVIRCIEVKRPIQ